MGRWQASTYITDEKTYNDLRLYLAKNNTTMCAVLMAGLKAVLAGKIDLDGNVIVGAKVCQDCGYKMHDTGECAVGNKSEDCETEEAQKEETAEQAETSVEQAQKGANGLDNKLQAAWQAVCDAQQAAHKATFGNVDSAIDEWLMALTDALGMMIDKGGKDGEA